MKFAQSPRPRREAAFVPAPGDVIRASDSHPFGLTYTWSSFTPRGKLCGNMEPTFVDELYFVVAVFDSWHSEGTDGSKILLMMPNANLRWAWRSEAWEKIA